MTLPHVHAAEDNTIRFALIGCGGRGSGAAVDAFKATGGPVKLSPWPTFSSIGCRAPMPP